MVEASGPHEDGPLYLIVTIRPIMEREDEARAALAGIVAGTRQEPGNIFMELVVDEDDPTTWYMLEKFHSRPDWDHHMTLSHVIDGNIVLGPLLRQPSELRFYTAR